ncbi:thymidylate synthase [Gemmatimonas aurantiaca]|uniref:thymidylate synthase n=1 Tax=Gemmatimonas aurantiaca TaxID=173480 RepID=UPI00301DF3FB
MIISCCEESLDDLLQVVFTAIRAHGCANDASRGGTQELIGASLELRNPRARLSVTESRGRVISALGELIWYLSGSNALDQISHYISKYANDADNGIIHGGYGPRFFAQRGINQIESVLTLLRSRPSTRRAVIQLFSAEDIAADHKEVPCTCTLQLLRRDERLHMVVSMRSNDAYLGLPHDIFCFTMLQEIFARSLGINMGRYVHFAGSLHLYARDQPNVSAFLREGWQPDSLMPEMPEGDPWAAVRRLIELEAQIRMEGDTPATTLGELDPYWADLVRLLLVLTYRRQGRRDDIMRIHGEIGDAFKPAVEARLVTM